ncbi:MAG TPA: molybdopterin-binding protein, partial [Xanthobacteraceae bacterium]
MVDPRNAAQRIERLLPLAEALASIEALIAPVAGRTTAVGVASGRILAADVTAAHAHPPAALALRDGVAVAADATQDASSYAPVALAGLPLVLDVGDPMP